jgi:glyoxylase-like metal-dependent hydrolase (beta-lactamase superfamily II)
MLKITQFDQVTRIDSARTVAGRGYYWSTAYLIDGLLIDTGCAHTASELVEVLSGKYIKQIINTHSHEDHIGGNGILQEQLKDIEILAHPLALPVMEDPRKNQPLQFYRRFMWGWPKPSLGKPVEDGAVIETEKFRFQVVYTPGHSPDHICLYEPTRGWLFTGDLFVGGRDRALRKEYRIWEIITTLKRVSELPLRMLLPGCARVRENPNQELADKIEYLEETGGKVLELHNKGMSVKRIARILFGGPMFIEYFTFGHFTRRKLVESYLAEN